MAETIHRIKLEAAEDPGRSSVGGRPILPQGTPWPECRTHKVPMVFVLQLDGIAGSPLAAGEHFLAFQCPRWNDIPEFAPVKTGEALPDAYWDLGEGHSALLVSPAGSAEQVQDPEPNLIPSRLVLEAQPEETKEVGKTQKFTIGKRGFKLGGVPSWAQAPQTYRCRCGSEMDLLLQVPNDFPFPKNPATPEQPNAYSKTKFYLFLGNEVYIFVCKKRCDPRAVWAIVQN